MLRQMRGGSTNGGNPDPSTPDPSTTPPSPLEQGTPVIVPNGTRVLLPIGTSLTLPNDYPVRLADGTRVMIPALSVVVIQALVYALTNGDANARSLDGQLILPAGTPVTPRQVAVRAENGVLQAQVTPIPAIYNGALVQMLGLTTATINADTIVTQ